MDTGAVSPFKQQTLNSDKVTIRLAKPTPEFLTVKDPHTSPTLPGPPMRYGSPIFTTNEVETIRDLAAEYPGIGLHGAKGVDEETRDGGVLDRAEPRETMARMVPSPRVPSGLAFVVRSRITPRPRRNRRFKSSACSAGPAPAKKRPHDRPTTRPSWSRAQSVKTCSPSPGTTMVPESSAFNEFRGTSTSGFSRASTSVNLCARSPSVVLGIRAPVEVDDLGEHGSLHLVLQIGESALEGDGDGVGGGVGKEAGDAHAVEACEQTSLASQLGLDADADDDLAGRVVGLDLGLGVSTVVGVR